MTDNNYKRPLIVGIFIFVGLAILIAAIFSIGNQYSFLEKKFSLKFIVGDASGLQIGSNVWLYGVKVGTVKMIEFYDKNKVEITMNIQKKAEQYIYKDSRVKIGTDGFLGNKIVAIFGGNVSSGIVLENEILITDNAVKLDDMLSTLQESNKSILEITKNLKAVSLKLSNGDGTIGALINNSAVYNSMESILFNLKSSSKKTITAMDNVSSFTKKINNVDGLINKLFSDTTLFNTLSETSSNLKSAASQANDFMINLKHISEKINDSTTSIGYLLNSKEVTEDIKEIITNLNSSSRKLDEDLEALQHNFLFKGYFKKKDKK